MKKVSILGSTGSIGRSALEVIASMDGEVEVVGLAAGTNAGLLAQQARAFHPRVAALCDAAQSPALTASLADTAVRVLAGPEGVAEVATLAEADTVISAMVGFAGLAPTLGAVRAGKAVALANKESLVAGGHLVRAAQKESGARVFPVDSEHAALSQCLEGCRDGAVKRLVLTASGGPFWGKKAAEVAAASRAQALAHPVWRMGAKITVDSATLMNKGLEVIEAHWLFDMPWDRIDVLIHPQSVVLSLVEMADGSYVAQLATADMRLPLQYALTYPERRAVRFRTEPLDLAALGRLEFARPSLEEFPCFALALAAGRAGGAFPAIMSAANEVAVGEFLGDRLPFGAIAEVIRATLDAGAADAAFETYGDIARADAWARKRAAEEAGRLTRARR